MNERESLDKIIKILNDPDPETRFLLNTLREISIEISRYDIPQADPGKTERDNKTLEKIFLEAHK